jgi:hypothetical protein
MRFLNIKILSLSYLSIENISDLVKLGNNIPIKLKFLAITSSISVEKK